MSTSIDVERIESLEKQVHELDAALKSSKRIRLVFLCAVIALMALIIYLFMGLFRKVTSDQFRTAVATEAQARFTENQDRYMNEVKSVVDGASPVVSEAFYQQSKEDMPKYAAALNQEREVFLTGVQEELQDQLRSRYGALLNQYESRLAAEFPELKDEEFKAKVMRSLDKALKDLVTRYYADELGSAVGGVYEGWDRFPPADAPALSGPQPGDQLIGTLLELMSHRLSH